MLFAGGLKPGNSALGSAHALRNGVLSETCPRPGQCARGLAGESIHELSGITLGAILGSFLCQDLLVAESHSKCNTDRNAWANAKRKISSSNAKSGTNRDTKRNAGAKEFSADRFLLVFSHDDLS
ncbi:MAG TPA: hypothetical protein VFN13_01790 [Rudaea sp.]|nr:hypothetical protein [Rudaea sp.]